MEKKNPVFREKALRDYVRRKEQAVLPKFVSPHAYIYLWILLFLLLGCLALVWFARVPAYASGPAIVCLSNNDSQSTTNEGAYTIVAFLPPQELAKLKVGQKLLIRIDSNGLRLKQSVDRVEPDIMSPADAQKKFNLSSAVVQSINRPSAVVVSRFEQPPSRELPTASYVGAIYHVDIEIGSRRLASLLPFLGRLAGDHS